MILKAILFANGDIKDYSILKPYFSVRNENLVICCDGGLRHAEKAGLWPAFILGDFDSVEPELLDRHRKSGVKILSYPTRKDETDLELGLRFAAELDGIEEIVIFGALGNRLDHSLANVQLLVMLLEKGIQGIIVDEKNRVRLIDKEIILMGKPGKILSLLPLSPVVEGVTTTGLEFPLRNETLWLGGTRGVSNIFSGVEAGVSIVSGLLLVIEARD